MTLRALLLATAVAALALVAPATGSAATFSVTTTADGPDAAPGDGVCATAGGACTLRAAVGEANTLTGPDVVVLPGGTYLLGAGLTVPATLTLRGAGARATVIDGGDSVRPLTVTGGLVRVEDLTIRRGSAFAGGAIHSTSADLELRRVTLRDNTASGGSAIAGGAIHAQSGTLAMSDSTIRDNVATSTGSQASGGAIQLNTAAQATIERSTITGNEARTSAPGSASVGGGIITFGTLTLRHVTLTDNVTVAGSAATTGGNLYTHPAATTRIANTIIAGGVAAPAVRNCGGKTPERQGPSLESDDTCGLPAGERSIDPRLGPLGANGGPTDTRVPALGSPAVGRASACPGTGADQRGAPAPAPAGGDCDIGAVELGADLRTSVTAVGGGVLSQTFVITTTNDGQDPAAGTTLPVALSGDGGPVGGTVTTVTTSAGSCSGAGPVACALGTLAPGTNATVTVTAPMVVGPGVCGGASLYATAAARSDLPDPDTTDDIAAAGTAMIPSCVPPPVLPTPEAPADPPAPDTTKPSLTSLKARGTFTAKKGGRVRMKVSEPGAVTVTVERVLKGRRSKGKCRTTARRGPRCTRYAKVGTVRRTAKLAGELTVTVPAKIGKNRLRKGARYRLTARVTDAAGNRSPVRRLTTKAR